MIFPVVRGPGRQQRIDSLDVSSERLERRAMRLGIGEPPVEGLLRHGLDRFDGRMSGQRGKQPVHGPRERQ